MATSTRKQPYTGHQSNGLSVGLLKRPFNSILNKIVLPFLLLTLLVAVSGTFIVTRVLAANVQDRLTNQLIDTARAASDRLGRTAAVGFPAASCLHQRCARGSARR